MINNSTNHFTSINSTTTSVHKKYVFTTKDTFIVKVIIYSLLTAFGLYAIVANSLILNFKRRQRRNVKERRAFDRFPVVSIYVQSLASSDLLCGIITVPLAIITNFWDIINDDMACKVVRFSNIFFPVVTMCNLFVIGIERYLAVFHPFTVPSKRIVRGLVLGAWVAGGLIALVPSATFSVQTQDIGPDSYTKRCIYDQTVPLYKGMFIGFTVIIYIIPSVILTFTSIRMLIFLRQRRNATFPNASNNNSSRFYGAFTFVALVLTFVLPYLLYVLFSSLNILLKFDLNNTAEFIVRRLSGVIAYANSAISPSVMLYNIPDLKRDLTHFQRNYLCSFANHENNSNDTAGFQDSNENKNFPRTITENSTGAESHLKQEIQRCEMEQIHERNV